MMKIHGLFKQTFYFEKVILMNAASYICLLESKSHRVKWALVLISMFQATGSDDCKLCYVVLQKMSCPFGREL